jgi:hypothetical protein
MGGRDGLLIEVVYDQTAEAKKNLRTIKYSAQVIHKTNCFPSHLFASDRIFSFCPWRDRLVKMYCPLPPTALHCSLLVAHCSLIALGRRRVSCAIEEYHRAESNEDLGQTT